MAILTYHANCACCNANCRNANGDGLHFGFLDPDLGESFDMPSSMTITTYLVNELTKDNQCYNRTDSNPGNWSCNYGDGYALSMGYDSSLGFYRLNGSTAFLGSFGWQDVWPYNTIPAGSFIGHCSSSSYNGATRAGIICNLSAVRTTKMVDGVPYPYCKPHVVLKISETSFSNNEIADFDGDIPYEGDESADSEPNEIDWSYDSMAGTGRIIIGLLAGDCDTCTTAATATPTCPTDGAGFTPNLYAILTSP